MKIGPLSPQHRASYDCKYLLKFVEKLYGTEVNEGREQANDVRSSQ
jgi:hypothetical protein